MTTGKRMMETVCTLGILESLNKWCSKSVEMKIWYNNNIINITIKIHHCNVLLFVSLCLSLFTELKEKGKEHLGNVMHFVHNICSSE